MTINDYLANEIVEVRARVLKLETENEELKLVIKKITEYLDNQV